VSYGRSVPDSEILKDAIFMHNYQTGTTHLGRTGIGEPEGDLPWETYCGLAIRTSDWAQIQPRTEVCRQCMRVRSAEIESQRESAPSASLTEESGESPTDEANG
jgi:hypothetical protein